ncbi:GPI transamidase component [Coemansia sp. RSA 2704]|nr:GPI transamidase component [Coemansia sp. RSA 2704]
MALGDKLRALLRRRNEPKTIISMHRERQVAVFSILLFMLLGLPLWWTTTRVYRADLPADSINRFAPGQTLAIPVVFYVDTDASLSAADTQSIEQKVQSLVDSQRQQFAAGEWRTRYQAMVRTGAAPKTPGHYTIQLQTGSNATTVDMGPDRSMAIAVPQATQAKGALIEAISAIVSGEERSVRGLAPKRAALKYAPEYAVTLTLLNEDPVGGAAVDWDVEQAVRAYLQPLVDELRPLTRLSISSQVLHHAGPPPVTPHRAHSVTYLTSDMLPHFINSPSWNFASIDPSSPMLNFVLFVPALASQPMRIYNEQDIRRLDKGGSPPGKSAFVVSQWGGVSIANLPQATRPGDKVVLSSADLQQHMGYFISQLRRLIGIHGEAPKPGTSMSQVHVHPATKTGISGWEYDALMRRWLVHNRQTAITTLQSLVRLVDSLQSMVVMDEIKTQVDQALHSLYAVDQALNLTSNLDYSRAFASAASAAAFAESAFFDPSMVSMLYFPDQHKYAIYMPFFLPVAMPLLAAVKKIVAERKRTRAARAAKEPAKTE